MRRYLAIVSMLIGICLLTGPAVASPPVTAGEACSDQPSRTTILVLEDTDDDYDIGSGTVALFPGTTIFVAYCGAEGAEDPRGGDLWELDTAQGLTNISQVELFYRAEITDATSMISVSDTVSNQEVTNDLRIEVYRTPTYVSTTTGGTITVNQTMRNRLNDAEAAFDSNSSAFNNTVRSLEASAERLPEAQGSMRQRLANMSEQLTRLNRSASGLQESSNELKNVLYDRLATETLPPSENATAVLEAVHNREVTAIDRAKKTVTSYRATLTELETRLQNRARMNLLIGLVPGLLVGLVAGAYGPWKKGKEADDFRDFGKMDFDKSVVRLPWGVGAGLVAVGLGFLFVTGLWRVII